LEADPDSNSLILIAFTQLLSINWSLSIYFLLIAFLLFCSGCVAGSEIAFFSINQTNLKSLSSDSGKSSTIILELLNKPKKLLATILISNNFINIAIVVISEYLLEEILPPSIYGSIASFFESALPFFNISALSWQNGLSFGINVIGVTFLIVLFGEGVPKIFARKNNMLIAKLMARPLQILSLMFSPLIQFLVSGSGFIEKRLASAHNSNNTTTKDELDDVIEMTVGSEMESDSEIDILKRIVKFGEVTVKQIMCSRADMIAVDFLSPYKEVLKVVKDSGFSRIPVFSENIDSLTGVLYAKDLIGFIDAPDSFEWQSLIRPNIVYAPESKKINELLKEFQLQKMHLAIVVDEYGGTEGLVTLEDIMEEVIGEIKDEFDDDAEVIFTKIDDYNFVFDGKTLLNDIVRITGIDDELFEKEKGDADSLAGLILEKLGTFPKRNQEVEINKALFKILNVNKRRIEKVHFTFPKELLQ
jgi:putative hemolysin